MWFQHDGAPAHFRADVRSALDTAYPGRWIGRGGRVNWPARSPELSCLDFFLWGHMKSFVYASPVDSEEALDARIAVVASEIRDMPGLFANVRHFLRRRCSRNKMPWWSTGRSQSAYAYPSHRPTNFQFLP
ncbi:uncharacterized protein TNCV_1830271 [Trichonephila clavipes]|nr:uncharacterized protein TNCV_1830271 [Trichonephila clavipes]